MGNRGSELEERPLLTDFERGCGAVQGSRDRWREEWVWRVLDEVLHPPAVQPFPDILGYKKVLYKYPGGQCSALLWLRIPTAESVVFYSETPERIYPAHFQRQTKYRTNRLLVCGVQFLDTLERVLVAAQHFQTEQGTLHSLYDPTFHYRLNEWSEEPSLGGSDLVKAGCGVGLHFYVDHQSAGQYTCPPEPAVITRVLRDRSALVVSCPRPEQPVAADAAAPVAVAVEAVDNTGSGLVAVPPSACPLFNTPHRVERVMQVVSRVQKTPLLAPAAAAVLHDRVLEQLSTALAPGGGAPDG